MLAEENMRRSWRIVHFAVCSRLASLLAGRYAFVGP